MFGMNWENKRYIIKLFPIFLIIITSMVVQAGCANEKLNASKKYYEKGIYYFNQKQYSQALDAFKKMIELRPSDPSGYNMIGLIYKELGNDDEAIFWLEKTIEKDSSFWVSYAFIGEIYADQKNYKKAIEWYTKSKEINPHAEMPYMSLCDIYIKQGEIDRAIKECNEAIDKLLPYVSSVRIKLGDIYASEGLYDDAIVQWQAAKEDPYYKKMYREYDPIEERMRNIQSLLEQ